MRNEILIAMTAVALLTAPTASSAQQLFDFDGQATIPTTVGETLSLVAEVLDGAPTIDTPLPLDFANFQYTLVIDGLTLDSVSGSTQYYSGGSITLYEDAGTVADTANPSTFSDGTAILSGTFDVLSRGSLLSLVQVSGTVDWTGGTRLGDLAPADRLDWPFFATASTLDVDPGYDENWDGKVEPTEPVVSADEESFGAFKSQW